MRVADELLSIDRHCPTSASPVYEELASLVRHRYSNRGVDIQAIIFSVAYAKYKSYKQQRATAEYDRCADENEFRDVIHTLVRSAPSHYDDWIRAGESLLDGVMSKANFDPTNGALDRLRPDLLEIGRQLSFVSELGTRTFDRLDAKGPADASSMNAGSGSRFLSVFIFDPIRNAATIMLAVAWLWLMAWGLEVIIPRLPDVIADLIRLVTTVHV